MIFKSLQNIESSFKMIRLIALISIVCSFLFSGTVYVIMLRQISAEREKIYVLDMGKSLMLALSQDMEQNRPIEARSHITMFHERFFGLAPDGEAIGYNMNLALHLADKSAYDYFKDLNEKDYYRRLISTNTQQRINIDSIALNTDVYPHTAKIFAEQTIVRESNITKRSLITSCQLENSIRSVNNPHGFLITKFRVEENNHISTVKR